MIEPKSNQLEQKGNAFLTYVIKVQEEKSQNTITSRYLLPLPFLQGGPVLSVQLQVWRAGNSQQVRYSLTLEFHFEKAWKEVLPMDPFLAGFFPEDLWANVPPLESQLFSQPALADVCSNKRLLRRNSKEHLGKTDKWQVAWKLILDTFHFL